MAHFLTDEKEITCSFSRPRTNLEKKRHYNDPLPGRWTLESYRTISYLVKVDDCKKQAKKKVLKKSSSHENH